MIPAELRVLIAHHRWWYPAASSGADIANQELAVKLKERGATVRVHGIAHPEIGARLETREYDAQGIPVCLVQGDFLKQLRAAVRDFRPHVALTTCPEPNCGPDDVNALVEVIRSSGVPIALYVHDLESTLPLFDGCRGDLQAVVTNSRFMAGRIREAWDREAHVVHPVPDWRFYHRSRSTGPFITFFNPLPHKGLGLAHTLVTKRFAERPFLFVEGFIDPEAHGIALSRSGNLVHARQSPDVSTIYGMTRTVIIPSQWEEPFGRIALEAMYHRTPVIASRTGGLPESMGDGGILIDDFANVDRWVEAIVRLDDPHERRKVIAAGARHVRRFSLDAEIDKLMDVLCDIAA